MDSFPEILVSTDRLGTRHTPSLEIQIRLHSLSGYPVGTGQDQADDMHEILPQFLNTNVLLALVVQKGRPSISYSSAGMHTVGILTRISTLAVSHRLLDMARGLRPASLTCCNEFILA